MKNIHMVDLHAQYLRIKNEIDHAIQDVVNSTAFINGPQVREFSKNLETYLEVKYVIPCANGTDALQIALMVLGLEPGDEVICPDFTFIASVEVIALLGLKPVLVDVDPVNFTIDTECIGRAITSRTKAIIPVHLFGLCANMSEILKIANEHKIAVIEDTAQAIGSTYNDNKITGKAGTLSDIGCTSFFPSKNLGCFGDGGAIFTNNEFLADKMRGITNHGSKIKYYNDEVGVNSRLDTLQAAVLNVKLKYLDVYCKARQMAAKYYAEKLKDIDTVITPSIPEYSDHVFHQYTIRVTDRRDALREYLTKKNIPTMIYYPVGIHNQKAYKAEGNFPVSDMLTKQVLSLPMHTELTTEQQEYICTHIREFFKSN
ncbi:MAG: DegT/DnrJ/EryC1/StrS family aminotransferase [Bacteroidales bacterium]|nr:DegT/DnrJ/EryC1/StrS family aminotransferase [Bacteroidales bacterium]